MKQDNYVTTYAYIYNMHTPLKWLFHQLTGAHTKQLQKRKFSFIYESLQANWD